MTHHERRVAGFVVAALTVAALWLWRLPNAEMCSRSGRIVDPTGRHCVSLDGSYVQLREHVQMHMTGVGWLLIMIAAALFLLRLISRRVRSRRAAQ